MDYKDANFFLKKMQEKEGNLTQEELRKIEKLSKSKLSRIKSFASKILGTRNSAISKIMPKRYYLDQSYDASSYFA